MTEHVVLRRAKDAMADLQHRRKLARDAIYAVDEEIDRLETFFEMYRHFGGEDLASDAEAAAFEQSTNPDAPAPISPPDVQATVGTARAKQSVEGSLSSEPVEVQDECAIHLPTNSPETANQSAAALKEVHVGTQSERANVVVSRSAASDGIEREAATTTPAGTQAPPADTNSPAVGNTRQQAVPVQSDATVVNARVESASGEISAFGAGDDNPSAANSASAAKTGKPAGEDDGAPAAPLTKKERVARTHEEHPDWTLAQIGAHLGITPHAVSGHLSMLGIRLGYKGPPPKKAPGEPTVREKVLAVREAHPDWCQKQIADELGIGTGSVANAVKGLDIEFPKMPNSAPKADSQRARVEAYLTDHPEATANEVSGAVGIPENSVRSLASVNGFKLGKARKEAARAAAESAAKPIVSAPVFVPPKGEREETTAKREEVAALNGIEPWLPPHEAAARLEIPVVNLRIFSSELGITWAHPRPEPEPKSSVSAEKSPTISQRVAALRRMHPTWTPALIAAELGIRASDVRAVMGEAVAK